LERRRRSARFGSRLLANNFGGQGLTTVTVRGFTTGEYYRNGFPMNRG